MKVLRNHDLYVATHVTGPTHNLLGLDFTQGRTPYQKDLSGSESASNVNVDAVRHQVFEALDEANIDTNSLVGIQFNAQDTPSETVYVELATAIVRYRDSDPPVDEFTPTWVPEESMETTTDKSCDEEE